MPVNVTEILESMPLGRGVKVLDIHREGLVALEKPCRILSHPNVDADQVRSLLNASWSQDRERFLWKVGGKSYRLYLLHRLDSATSGVILACVNPNLARELKAQFSKRRVVKSYTAIVSGVAAATDSTWRDMLKRKHTRSGLRMEFHARGGRPAETRVKIIKIKRTFPKLSLLRLHPLTGRTHQLRVQCAKRKLHIVGDTTYGDFAFNRKVQKALGIQRLFLHATAIRIRWEWKGSPYEFQTRSGLPKVFKELMELEIPRS